jgi:hypothetical protein
MPPPLATGVSPGTMSHMTGATETTDDARSRDAELPVSVALVAALVMVHLVMAYYVYALSDAIFDLVNRLAGQELARMAVTLAPAVPLVLAVFFWARDRILGCIAATVVVAVGLSPYYVGDWSGWVQVALVPFGAALGWGIARRRGSAWWPGLIVAAAVAALFYWLEVNAFDDASELRPPAIAFTYHVVPALLGGLACWWLETRAARE